MGLSYYKGLTTKASIITDSKAGDNRCGIGLVILLVLTRQCRKFVEKYCRPAGPATPKISFPGLKVAGPAVNLNNFIFFFLFQLRFVAISSQV